MGACSSKKATEDSIPPKAADKPESTTNGNGKADTKPAAEADLSQAGLLAMDAELVSKKDQFVALAQKFNVPASDDTLASTKAALEGHGFVVEIFPDAKAALDFITAVPKEGQSISSGGSRTLDEIGFKDWAKSQSKFKDFKAEALSAEAKGDYGAAMQLRKEGSNADVYFSSCSAVTQDGTLSWASLTGTRLSLNAGTLVVVVGTQKIVADQAAADERLYDWQLPIESARVRIVYKAPSSAINEVGTLRQVNPFAPKGSVVIVFVRGVWGY